MIARRPGAGAPRPFKFAACFLALALTAPAQATTRDAAEGAPHSPLVRATRVAFADEAPAKVRIAITLAGDPACGPRLRAVLAGQLADVAAAVIWECRAQADADAPFRAGAAAGDGANVRVWIDLSPADEARITLQDERESRFFLRRLPLPAGVGEIGREEIADVVRSGAIALLTGAAGVVSRAEAKATASRWPAPVARPAPVRAADAAPPPAPPMPWTFELGPLWTAQALARALPFVQEVAVAGALSAPSGRISLWSQAGYRLPGTYAAASVGVRLTALTVRAGATWWTSPAGALRVGLGGGLGARRVWFAPQGDAAAVDPAAPDHFDTLAGRLVVALQLRATARLTVRLDLLCDVATADVHYDLKNSSGAVERTLTQWPVQPGFAVAATWRWGV